MDCPQLTTFGKRQYVREPRKSILPAKLLRKISEFILNLHTTLEYTLLTYCTIEEKIFPVRQLINYNKVYDLISATCRIIKTNLTLNVNKVHGKYSEP